LSTEALMFLAVVIAVAVALTLEAVDSRSDEFERAWQRTMEAP
jgi:hypothetical protein